MSFIFSNPDKKRQEGREKGVRDYQRDKKIGKIKRSATSFKELFTRLSWSSDEYDAFVKGYYEGYDEAWKANVHNSLLPTAPQRNNIHTISNNQKSFNMAQKEFHLQSLEVVDDFQRRIEQFKEDLKAEMNALKTYFDNLESSDDWNDKYHEAYKRSHLAMIEAHLNRIIATIENESQMYLQTYRRRAEELDE